MQETKTHLIALSSIPDIGPVTIRRLVSSFGSPEKVFSASEQELARIEGMGAKRAQGIKGFSGWAQIERMLERLNARGVRVLTQESDGYPETFKNLHDAPPVIYIRGSLVDEDKYALAVVGTRSPTIYGESQAEKIAGELARVGFTVVSGLARGVDTAAHKGALRAGGRSIGVMGSGIDVPYPAENRLLMDKLSTSGCVLSEFTPGTKPNRENFPRRNRLISALAMGVLVVEATMDSGSLITVNCALEQGKEVFSVPGPINSMNSGGTNELIKKGARLVTGAEDILEELAPVLKGFLAKSPGKPAVELEGEEQALLNALTPEPQHVDDIARGLAWSASKVLGILLALELKGIVRQGAGKRFSIC